MDQIPTIFGYNMLMSIDEFLEIFCKIKGFRKLNIKPETDEYQTLRIARDSANFVINSFLHEHLQSPYGFVEFTDGQVAIYTVASEFLLKASNVYDNFISEVNDNSMCDNLVIQFMAEMIRDACIAHYLKTGFVEVNLNEIRSISSFFGFENTGLADLIINGKFGNLQIDWPEEYVISFDDRDSDFEIISHVLGSALDFCIKHWEIGRAHV